MPLTMSGLEQSFLALPFSQKAMICFVVTWLLDVCYTMYTRRTTMLDSTKAANWGTLVYLMSAINIVGYSKDIRLLIPILCGAWVGTKMAVMWESRTKNSSHTAPQSPHPCTCCELHRAARPTLAAAA